MVKKNAASILLLVIVLSAQNLWGQGWKVHLTGNNHAPETILAVDKNSQNFLVFSNESPLHNEHTWQCTTGQAQGTKMLEGDLKTPEGIYFLERKITANLPYDLYGKMAFTLNYPNPVDRIQNKTGHSIWIHGRGKEVVPFDTEGCVAMDMQYMLALDEKVDLMKTPVVIAEDVTWEPVETTGGELEKIARLSQDWARNWQRGSQDYFDHYHQDLYPLSSGQSFSGFRNYKQRLFSRYDWMDVYIEDPRVVAGPDYWVSYFGQVFKAPDFFSAGVKRLDWKKDENNQFRIVGEEWGYYPDDQLKQRYVESVKHEIYSLIARWRKAWIAADLEEYAQFYHSGAVQNNLTGLEDIRAHKLKLWNSKGLVPEKIDIRDIEIYVENNAFRVEFVQDYVSSSGYSDYGRKTMMVAPVGDEWQILSESWREMG